ncbi:MAG: hypothetical protein PHH23_07315 [Paludibacteraceae bacterium]|jgi:hypothetical protein|nr:hypothetical protein [Paludibacteraceae bacterium]
MRKTTTLHLEKDLTKRSDLKPSSRTIVAILAFSATYHVEKLVDGQFAEMLLN